MSSAAAVIRSSWSCAWWRRGSVSISSWRWIWSRWRIWSWSIIPCIPRRIV